MVHDHTVLDRALNTLRNERSVPEAVLVCVDTCIGCRRVESWLSQNQTNVRVVHISSRAARESVRMFASTTFTVHSFAYPILVMPHAGTLYAACGAPNVLTALMSALRVRCRVCTSVCSCGWPKDGPPTNVMECMSVSTVDGCADASEKTSRI